MSSNFRLVDLCGLAAVGLVMAALLPGFTGAGAAHKVSCQNNQRQIGAAVASYVNDHDGALPVVNDRTNWKKGWCLENELVKYLGLEPTVNLRKSPNVLQCGAEATPETFTRISYVMNVNLNTVDAANPAKARGGKMALFDAPAKIIALTDGANHLLDNWKTVGKDDVTRPRHDGNLNVLMLDGSVTSVQKLSALPEYNWKSSWLCPQDRNK